MMIKLIGYAFIFLSCFFSNSYAVTIAKCGESEGFGYYFEGGIIRPGEGGWQKDGISNGSFEFIIENNTPDIAYVDSTQIKKRSSADGFKVNYFHSANDNLSFILVMVNYQTGVVEHWLFKFNEIGLGKAVWGTIRAADSFSAKSALMTSSCELILK